MLRVGFDISPLELTRAGTAVHVEQLSEAIAREGTVELRPYRLRGGSRPVAALRDLLWYPLVLPRTAAHDRVDVLHCPTYRAPPGGAVPVVVTVHDLAILRHPYLFNRWNREYSSRMLPHVARAAAAVIAVSEFTRSEVVELLEVPPERVHVVPNGVGAPFSTSGPPAAGDYVLAVGTLEPRKNLPRLVEGFQQARLDGCELRVVGAPGWGSVRATGRRVRLLGEIDQAELAALYRGARCVAYVSLYEGFGLPVAEAMACGAPVVISQARALVEVADGAAVVVDALDPESIARGLEEAVERRDELARRGLARAKTFSWEAAARRTIEVYQAVAAGSASGSQRS